MIWKGGIVKMDDNIIYPSIDGYYEKMNIHLSFPDKVSFLDGDSGTGKSFLVNALDNQGLAIELFNHRNLNTEKRNSFKDFILSQKGFLILIDNADILLDDALRELIVADKNNQYLIIGRDPRGLFLSERNFVSINLGQNTISLVKKY